MNGTDFLADTNAVIYLLSGNNCMKPYLQKTLAVSVISFMELLSFPGITGDEEKMIRQFLNMRKIIQIDKDVMEKTIQLRREYKIKLPDAIIAATALILKIPLISADTEFCKIVNLQLEQIKP